MFSGNSLTALQTGNQRPAPCRYGVRLRKPPTPQHCLRVLTSCCWKCRQRATSSPKTILMISYFVFYVGSYVEYLGWPHVVAVVAVPSRQKCPSGQGWSAAATPVTSHTRPAGHTRGTGMPSSGQWKPTGHRRHALRPRLG